MKNIGPSLLCKKLVRVYRQMRLTNSSIMAGPRYWKTGVGVRFMKLFSEPLMKIAWIEVGIHSIGW